MWKCAFNGPPLCLGLGDPKVKRRKVVCVTIFRDEWPNFRKKWCCGIGAVAFRQHRKQVELSAYIGFRVTRIPCMPR